MRISYILVVPSLTSVSTCTGSIKEYTDDGNFYFPDEVNLGSALGKVLRRQPVRLGRGRCYSTTHTVQLRA